ncbi:MAG TPA: ABC transporter permease [Gemmatimonadaceae bacterium]|nr:ABC transporter permease [Gemmatimonadaceae bacterium]
MPIVAQLLRNAARTLRMNLTFTVVTALTLALGLGAATAVFSIVDAVLLRPLPYPDPERLVVLFETAPDNDRRNAAPANFLDWRRESRTVTSLAAYRTSRQTLTGGAAPERVLGAAVSANIFSMLGASARFGRVFRPAEDSAGAQAVAVLSDALWRRQFGGDPGVIGRTVRLDDSPVTIVGVMPPDFLFPETADLWTLADRGVPPLAGFAGDIAAARDLHYFTAIGRLRPGASIGAARTELAQLAGAIATLHPETNRDLGVNVVPLRDALVGDRRATVLILFGIVGFVLLIVCANVASLMLASSAARAREFSVRAALGASRSRLVAQVAAESLLLALLGGTLGVIAAGASVRALAAAGTLGLPEIARVTVDGRVFAFAMVLACVSGLGAGLVPAMRVSAAAPFDALREGGRSSTGSGRQRLRQGLVVIQLALSLTLLVGAGLLLKSYEMLVRVDPGFRRENVLTLETSLSHASYGTPSAIESYYDRAIASIARVPGVRSVGAVSNLPVSGRSMNRGLQIDGRAKPERATDQTIEYQVALASYFQTLGIPLRRGRVFEVRDDAQAAPVAVVNESAVRKYWPAADPVGARVGFGNRDGGTTWRTIVGVVGDVHHFGLDRAPRPELFVPMAQDPQAAMNLVARASGPGAPASAVRRAVSDIDPLQPVSAGRSMDERMGASVARPRFLSRLLAGFAVAALALSALGLYGVLAQIVGSRTREIGLRMALGAQSTEMLRMVLRQACTLAGLGVLAGLAGALAVTRLVSSLLFSVEPTDPAVFAETAVLLVFVTIAAAFLPAYRASRVDPAVALRREG